MQSPVYPDLTLSGLSYTQLPGTASALAASPDGSLWALSDQPGGADKYIWHYANATWTNVSGLASALAAAPDGTLYAVNSGGGIYKYSGGTWTALGGGGAAITVALDGAVFVTSNGGSGDRAIWALPSGANQWVQQPGSGVALSASWDSGNNYQTSGGTINIFKNFGGVFILNSAGDIWYEGSRNQIEGPQFVQLSGSASAIASTLDSGIFVLGYPSNPNGDGIYYYDLNSLDVARGWAAEPGAGVNICVGYNDDGDTTLYVLGAGGGIYSTRVVPVSVLAGGSTSTTATSSGATLGTGGFVGQNPQNAYNDSTAFSANDAAAGFDMTMAWGTPAQIAGNIPAGSLPATIGAAFLYLDVADYYVSPTTSSSNGSFVLNFSRTPAFNVTTNGSFPGTMCGWAYSGLDDSGHDVWYSMTALGIPEVQASGNVFMVPSAASSFQFRAGRHQYIALYCH